MIARLMQRWNDWLLERAIAGAREDAIKAVLRNEKDDEKKFTREMYDLIKQRSPAQVERMERAQGIFRRKNDA